MFVLSLPYPDFAMLIFLSYKENVRKKSMMQKSTVVIYLNMIYLNLYRLQLIWLNKTKRKIINPCILFICTTKVQIVPSLLLAEQIYDSLLCCQTQEVADGQTIWRTSTLDTTKFSLLSVIAYSTFYYLHCIYRSIIT